MSRELDPYLRERAQLGSEGLALGLALSIGLHAAVVAAILFVPTSEPVAEATKVTWVTLPTEAGVKGVAGGQGPVEEGKTGERLRRVEEVAPKAAKAGPAQPTPNAWGTKATNPVTGTSARPESTGKAPVASKGKTPAPSPAPGAAGKGGGGGIGTATGIPGLRATHGVAGGTGLVEGFDTDFPFTYYTSQIQARITENWNRLTEAQGRVQIYFRIGRDGHLVGDPRVEIPSGNNTFDQSALMAIRRAEPLPHLPDGYEGQTLGVRFWFTYLGN